MSLTLRSILLILFSAFFNAGSVFIFKYRLNQSRLSFESLGSFLSSAISFIKSPVVLIAIIMFTVAPLIFLMALNKTNVTIAYPILVALNFLIIIILSLIFLNETLSTIKLISIFLIILSLYLFYR